MELDQLFPKDPKGRPIVFDSAANLNHLLDGPAVVDFAQQNCAPELLEELNQTLTKKLKAEEEVLGREERERIIKEVAQMRMDETDPRV